MKLINSNCFIKARRLSHPFQKMLPEQKPKTFVMKKPIICLIKCQQSNMTLLGMQIWGTFIRLANLGRLTMTGG